MDGLYHGGMALLPGVLFFASGAAGLVYQVVWMRHAALHLGGTTAAAGTVVATFLGGLALGSFWGGRVVDRAIRTRRPGFGFRAYGALEIAIGVYALVFEPLLAGLFAIPLIVFLPLFILFFGIGMESKIAFGASYAFFPIALNTIGGISQVDPRFVTVARSMGANDAQLFRRVLLPAALPVIVTGLRMGCIIAFLSILGSEMIAGLRGLGSRVAALAEGMNTAEMFAYIVFVILLAALLNTMLTKMQRRFSEAGQAP